MVSMFEGATGTTVTVWMICLLLAAGVAWTRYEKRRTRDKFLRELMAMDPARREKLLSRLRPEIQNDLRQQLMERFRMS
jgi:cytochrome c-type biogenesis protein CcmH/NrfF